MNWKRILAYITGTIDRELLSRNEYLVAENRILRSQLKERLRLTDDERRTLGEIAYRLGRKALQEIATAAKPDTLLGWYRRLIASGGVTPVALPPMSPNLNAHAERRVKSVKDECLSKMILFSESSLRFVLQEYCAHYHGKRNHQGKGNVLLFPSPHVPTSGLRQPIRTRERIGGLLRYYNLEAA
jgi:hypothetical protein